MNIQLSKTGKFLLLSSTLLCILSRTAQAQSPSTKAIVEIGGEADIGVTLDKPQAAFLVAGNGILVVEERSAPFLKLLDSRGKRRQLLGRVGSGPGEYRYFSAAAYDSSSRRLAVFDPALRRVAVASRTLGVVQTLDIASGRVSATSLKGFIPLEFIAAERGGLLLQRGKSGEADEIAAVRFRGSEQSVIVGHLMGANQGLGDYSRVQELSVARQLPVGAQQRTAEVDAANGRVLCYSVSPFPTIHVVSGGRCP